MLGAIIGDIVGSRFEFNPLRTTDFELFTSECSFTDDTVCTVAVADAIMNKNGDFLSSLVDWCTRYRYPMGGYGARFSQWITNPVPYNSFGNGAVMRISPIPLLCTCEADLTLLTKEATAVSHNHPDAIRYAVGVNMCTYQLCRGEDKEKAIANAMRFIGIDRIPSIEPHANPFDETIYNCVPVALLCLLRSTDFESAIRNVMIMGGDVDTIGACVGGMAEALYGIPDAIQRRALEYLPQDMLGVVNQFYSCNSVKQHRRGFFVNFGKRIGSPA